MSVKIRVSYETPEELNKVLAALGAEVKRCKVPEQQKGPYKKAYITIMDAKRTEKE